MARKKKKVKKLGTIWEVSDDLWERILPVLRKFWPKKKTGRKLANWRQIFNGIIFRMRSGCQWEKLPPKFGPKSTVHQWFQRWNQNGIMAKIMAALIRDCAELGGVSWQWQSADGAMAKARFGGTTSAPTPRIGPKTAPNAAWSLRKTVVRSAS